MLWSNPENLETIALSIQVLCTGYNTENKLLSLQQRALNQTAAAAAAADCSGLELELRKLTINLIVKY